MFQICNKRENKFQRFLYFAEICISLCEKQFVLLYIFVLRHYGGLLGLVLPSFLFVNTVQIIVDCYNMAQI